MSDGEGALDPAARSAVEKALGHCFLDASLLDAALAHPSYAHERDGTRGNERLEFLGDAVLDLAVAQLLFEAHAGWSEGDLTRARAALVNTRSLARCARELGIGTHARLGRTEKQDRRLREGARARQRVRGADRSVVSGRGTRTGLRAGAAPLRRSLRHGFGAARSGSEDPIPGVVARRAGGRRRVTCRSPTRGSRTTRSASRSKCGSTARRGARGAGAPSARRSVPRPKRRSRASRRRHERSGVRRGRR